ncbi:MAG: HEAT repeat domain-containing protein, partial [Candidatus Rokubacteria bacterium]|nr:HEAT repeat domain-containing protein [Candidatus Rokubacteria bacterium]
LYPPENELNVALQERLERQAQALLERVPTVTLALADDNIVINGIRPHPKWFGITSPLLHKLMQETGLTSVTLTRGVSREDFQILLTQLAQPATEDAMTPVVLAKLLEERGITTIQVGSRSYAAARASLRAAGKPGGTDSEEGASAGTHGVIAGPGRSRSEEDRLFEQVAQWLDASLGASNLREEEIPAAVDSWLASDRKDLADRLWERLMAALESPMEGTRQRGAAGLNLLLTGANVGTLTWLREQSFEPLEKALLKETSPRVFQWQVRATVEALKLLLKEGELARVASLAEALGKGQAGKPNEKRLVPLATAAVENMAATGVFQPLLGALKESDPARREQARAVLAALGEGSLQFVVNIVTKEEDAEVRKIAATLLRSLPGAGLRLIVPQLHPPTPPETTRRIVGVLNLLAPELGPDFFSLLAHSDVLVRAEFTGVLSSVRRPAAAMFLSRALAEPQPQIAAGALEGVRALHMTELVDPIVRLLRKDAPPDLLKACCACLGQLKNEEAIDPLVDVLRQRPRFLGLVRGFPETVRAAAARALGELPFPQAQDALRAVLKDGSLAVRSTARLALARLKQGRESR